MKKCLKIPKQDAEKVRQKLIQKNLIDYSWKISAGREFIYFPITSGSESKAKALGVIVSKNTKKIKKEPRSIAEFLSGKLSTAELKHLKTSFDIFGEVIVVEIPEELQKKEKVIGDAFLKLYKNVRAVFKKTSEVAGVERVRKLKKITGTGTAETIYREHGCTFKFDISKVFFSPRLAMERGIVSEKVKAGETVLCMFAGVGPFAIIIAKKQQKIKKIFAIDINKIAIDYLKENAELNHVSEKIEAVAGDSCVLVPKKFSGVADRVIMNLPKTSEDFLPIALKGLKKQGGIVHFYTFQGSEEGVKQEIKVKIPKKRYKILEIRNVKPYAPGEYCFCADIKIYK